MKNSITLLGNTGKDPELKTLEGGSVVMNISLATSETYKDKAGEKKTITEWHSLIAWGAIAETINKYVKKGDALMVDGKLTYQKWEKDGVKHEKAVVQVSKVYLMPNNRNEDKPAAKQEPVKQDEQSQQGESNNDGDGLPEWFK